MPMFFFDPFYLIFISPAIILALWAQFRVRSTYAQARQIPARLSGAEAARLILNSAGLTDVDVDMVPGELTDHYSPSERVIRLSPDVYRGRSLASVGIAAHEVGHALQHAHGYAPLMITQIAYPAANFGSSLGLLALLIGLGMGLTWLAWVGVYLFSAVVIFQVINLPVEFNASRRAKQLLVERGIVSPEELTYVNRVLNAAAWTYVAATLQAILTLLYYLLLVSARDRDR
ncbi:putative metal-dependent peptidase [Thermogutta terrifontis]|uniref:Putative metal-dependent peptidase n=2 Tax=Thermogutta terrifontis TaxID=1331910 RepID=A0A286REY3_9BACT|nr:putative metal-dependent peptidase [Thermogutta terrifontis]